MSSIYPKTSTLNKIAEELVHEAPWFRAVAKELGIEGKAFNNITKEEAAAVRAAAQDSDVLSRARAAIGNKGTPDATRTPADVKAALDAPTPRPASAPPNVDDAFRVDFPSGKDAAAGAGKGFQTRAAGSQRALPPGDQGVPVGAPYAPNGAPPFHGTTTIDVDPRTGKPIRADLENAPSTDVRPHPSQYVEPETGLTVAPRPDGQTIDVDAHTVYPGTGSTATQGRTEHSIGKELDAKSGRRAKIAAGAAGAGLVGAGASGVWGEPDPTRTKPGAATDDSGELEVTDGAVTKPKAAESDSSGVDAAGKIDPEYIKDVPKWIEDPYAGKLAPDAIKPEEYVEVDGVRVRPTDLMAKAQKELIAATTQLAAEYRAERDQQKQAALWEGIVQSVGLIAAGVYGMRNGVDMSGVKFSPTDWVAQQEALRRQYDTLQGLEKDKYGAKTKTAESAAGDLKDRNAALERAWAREMDVIKTGIAVHNQRQDARFRQWQADVKGIELNNQIVHWNKEMAHQTAQLDAALGKARTKSEFDQSKAALRQAEADQKAGQAALRLLTDAADSKKSKDTEAGMMRRNQAIAILTDLESRGRSPLPKGVTVKDVVMDERAGNLLPVFGENKPGLASPDKIVKSINDAESKNIQGAMAPTPAAQTTPKKLRHKASGLERILTPDEIRQLKNPGDFEVVQ